ncbi:MAG TPA: alpha/beta hydrolase [Acidimicrobiia bacterium]
MISALFFTWFFAATLWTVNALRRPVPPGRGLAPLWLPGMIVSELAPWLLVVRALVALAFIGAGALDLAIGRVGFALFVVSELGLLPLLARSWRSAREAGATPTPVGLFRARIGVPTGVRAIRELRYWDDLTLDVYTVPGARSAPALIYLHPGSWMRGRPGRQALPMLYRLAATGWVVLDIRYPLSPDATFPDHLIGVKRAIAWAKGEGSSLGIDPARVAIAGASSGAHLAALAALTWDHPDLQPGFEKADTSLIACAPHYGIYDLLVRNPTRYDWPFVARHVMKAQPLEAPELYRLGSPLDLVRPDAPPFLVVHGSFDSVVLAEESRVFVNALRHAGAEVDYHEVRGGQHGFDAIASLRTRSVGDLVADFLIAVANPETGSSAPATGSEQEG